MSNRLIVRNAPNDDQPRYVKQGDGHDIERYAAFLNDQRKAKGFGPAWVCKQRKRPDKTTENYLDRSESQPTHAGGAHG